jgi:hypothetical protein
MITYLFHLFQSTLEIVETRGGFHVMGEVAGNRVPFAYTTTRDEAEQAREALLMFGRPQWTGLTRDQAIAVAQAGVAQLEVLAENRKNSVPFVAGLRQGMAMALKSLAAVGAFNDGKNMADRLPPSTTEVES